MLHHPFEHFTDLLSFDGYDYVSYADAFYACQRLHTHTDDFYTDPTSDDEDESEDEELVRDESDDGPLADFEIFARRRAGNHDLTCSATDDLGSRDRDRSYDWTSHVGRDLTTPEAWD
jgi:hypothetical protein